jgi:hypothetical protein
VNLDLITARVKFIRKKAPIKTRGIKKKNERLVNDLSI